VAELNYERTHICPMVTPAVLQALETGRVVFEVYLAGRVLRTTTLNRQTEFKRHCRQCRGMCIHPECESCPSSVECLCSNGTRALNLIYSLPKAPIIRPLYHLLIMPPHMCSTTLLREAGRGVKRGERGE